MGRPLNKRIFGDVANPGSQIAVLADVGGGALPGYIVRQRSSTRFEVTTAGGTEVCKLVASATPGAGEFSIELTDSAAGTYYASKISARTVTVEPGTGAQFASGDRAAWNRTAAQAGVSLLIAVA